jgi:hypothetical protein
MADEHSPRSYRSTETIARSGNARASSQPATDPLAELARLIGQEDPFGDFGREASRGAAQPASQPAMDWAAPPAEGYARPQQNYQADTVAVPPQAAPVAYETEPDIPAYLMQRGAAQSYAQQPAYAEGAYAQQAYPGAPQVGAQDQDLYDDLPPERRRLGVLAIAGVLALAVVGAAGAFGYRAVFGSGTHMPPPVIKADTAPSKIVPEKTAKDGNKVITERINGAGEKIVSREERPVDIRDKIATPVFPPPGGPGTQSASAMPTQGSGVIDTEPHKVHTIVIRPDQPMVADAGPTSSLPQAAPSPVAMPEPQPVRPAPPLAPARAAAPVARETTVRQETPRAQAQAANAPLSLNPNVAPAPARRAPTRVANAAPVSLAAAPSANPASAARGGYAVQVTSQRSDAEAQAAYRALQGKYGSVLGSRSMFVHKVELGAKGTYYRAMVGPFTTQADAAKLCSSLKSAGGSCLVQRN